MGDAPSKHDVDKEYQAHFKLDGYTLDVAKKRAKLVYGMVMMMPGVPCIFYGDELGMQGYGDPFCRACFPWNNMDEVDPGSEMREWIKKLAALRKSSKALSTGEFNYVYRIGHVYAFIRQDAKDKFVILINCGGEHRDARLDAARYGITRLETLFGTDEERMTYESADGIFYMKAQPYSMVVFKA